MKGDCTSLKYAHCVIAVGDDSQMKGDCTVHPLLILLRRVGDDSQMKGDCTGIVMGRVLFELEMTPK